MAKEWIETASVTLTFAMLGGLIALALRRALSDNQSQFQKRDADRPRRQRPFTASEPTDAPTREEPLPLEGFSLHQPPHEVLGVSEDATTEEIQRAYKRLMKRYHPDRVGRPGSREWKDAQPIAEAIIRAKDTLLRRRRP